MATEDTCGKAVDTRGTHGIPDEMGERKNQQKCDVYICDDGRKFMVNICI